MCAQVGEEDYNQDGKPELIRFTATAQSRYPVNSFKMLLQFSYALQVKAVKLAVTSCWCLPQAIPLLPACAGTADAARTVQQRQRGGASAVMECRCVMKECSVLLPPNFAAAKVLIGAATLFGAQCAKCSTCTAAVRHSLCDLLLGCPYSAGGVASQNVWPGLLDSIVAAAWQQLLSRWRGEQEAGRQCARQQLFGAEHGV